VGELFVCVLGVVLEGLEWVGFLLFGFHGWFCVGVVVCVVWGFFVLGAVFTLGTVFCGLGLILDVFGGVWLSASARISGSSMWWCHKSYCVIDTIVRV